MNNQVENQFLKKICKKLKKKFFSNNSRNNINKLAIERSIMRLKYPFLNEIQIRGRVYDMFNFRNYFGNIL